MTTKKTIQMTDNRQIRKAHLRLKHRWANKVWKIQKNNYDKKDWCGDFTDAAMPEKQIIDFLGGLNKAVFSDYTRILKFNILDNYIS